MLVHLRLDPGIVYAGEPVTLEERVDSKADIKVFAISHKYWKIGEYDPKSQSLFNLDPRHYKVCLGIEGVDEKSGLPAGMGSSSPLDLDIKTATYKGLKFTFRPKDPGIYMIRASWGKTLTEPSWESSPVVLVVNAKKKEENRR